MGGPGLPRRLRNLRLGLSVSLAFLLASFLVSASAPPRHDFWAPGESRARAAALLDGMSDEEVLGQLFMLAYPGDAPPDLLFEWIAKRGLGGVKIFGWNADNTDRLAEAVAAIQKAALSSRLAVPLLIATDQEGGWIRHVKGATSVTPGNMAIGASGRPYDAWWSAYYIGRELDALGINMNFAPAVDLATRPKSSIVGPRAFSSDPEATAALATAYFRGLQAAGIIATAKHFPGHGDTELDSHGILPVIRIGTKTLWDRELVPYRVLAVEGIPAIMSGHLNFPLVTGDSAPASLSRTFMTGILRDRLGFKGVAVTDDLLMSGAAGGADLAEACYRAIDAGNDLIMASRIIGLDDAAWTGLLTAYRGNPAFRARVREAAARVLALKLDYLRPKGEAALVPNTGRLASRLPDRDGQRFFAGQAFRAATAITPGSLPWKYHGKILVAATTNEALQAAGAVYAGSAGFKYSIAPDPAAHARELEAFQAAASAADSVLVCVQTEGGMDFADRARALGKKVAVLSLLSPEPLARLRPADSAVAVYGSSRQCVEAGLAVLHGDAPGEGVLPLRLEP
jgi:beta-N-acetylhexosaminidase